MIMAATAMMAGCDDAKASALAPLPKAGSKMPSTSGSNSRTQPPSNLPLASWRGVWGVRLSTLSTAPVSIVYNQE